MKKMKKKSFEFDKKTEFSKIYVQNRDKVTKKDGKVSAVEAKLNLENKDFKKTTKITWLAEHPECKFTPAVAVAFENIITKPVLEKEDDFKNFINRNSRSTEKLICDHQLANCKEGDIIQLQRRGFYRVDQPYIPADGATFQETPAILFAIPDGKQKEKQGKENVKPVSNKQTKKAKQATPTEAPKATPQAAPSGGNLALWEEVNNTEHSYICQRLATHSKYE